LEKYKSLDIDLAELIEDGSEGLYSVICTKSLILFGIWNFPSSILFSRLIA
jgi:hypothetical protein